MAAVRLTPYTFLFTEASAGDCASIDTWFPQSMKKVVAAEVPPPGAGLMTVMLEVPATVTSAIVITACSSDGLT
jgi:hypothetical protein